MAKCFYCFFYILSCHNFFIMDCIISHTFVLRVEVHVCPSQILCFYSQEGTQEMRAACHRHALSPTNWLSLLLSMEKYKVTMAFSLRPSQPCPSPPSLREKCWHSQNKHVQCQTFPLVLLSGTSENWPRTSKNIKYLPWGKWKLYNNLTWGQSPLRERACKLQKALVQWTTTAQLGMSCPACSIFCYFNFITRMAYIFTLFFQNDLIKALAHTFMFITFMQWNLLDAISQYNLSCCQS